MGTVVSKRYFKNNIIIILLFYYCKYNCKYYCTNILLYPINNFNFLNVLRLY